MFRGSIPCRGRNLLHSSRPALGPTQPSTQWIPDFSPGVKRPGRGVDHPSPRVPPRLKSRAIFPLPLRALMASCTANFVFLQGLTWTWFTLNRKKKKHGERNKSYRTCNTWYKCDKLADYFKAECQFWGFNVGADFMCGLWILPWKSRQYIFFWNFGTNQKTSVLSQVKTSHFKTSVVWTCSKTYVYSR